MYEELVKRLREESEIERWLQPHSANETPKLLDDAADAIEELEKSIPRWIPVTERYPEIDRENSCSEYVVVRLENGTYCIANYVQDTKGKEFFECDRLLPCGAMYGKVTHWMPLPEPPKEELV